MTAPTANTSAPPAGIGFGASSRQIYLPWLLAIVLAATLGIFLASRQMTPRRAPAYLSR
jgi:hypothetical protein